MTTYGGIGAAVWLLAACGAAFHTGGEEGPGGSPGAEAGQAGEPSRGGEATRGGAPRSEGGAGAGGAAGASSELGAAGNPEERSRCAQLGGVEDAEGHCYVDVTVGTATQAEAVEACEALSPDAHLLVLNTTDEQDFIFQTFLRQYQNVSDAWLGLTCSAESHPQVDDCFCAKCSVEQLAAKQAAWSWPDGTTATFGWVNSNPNSGERCAAFGFNPTAGVLEPWGWVERDCDLAKVTIVAGNPHTYRTICELGRE